MKKKTERQNYSGCQTYGFLRGGGTQRNLGIICQCFYDQTSLFNPLSGLLPTLSPDI